MERISSIFRLFKSKTVIYWAIAAMLVIAAGGYYFYEGRAIKEDTLTVHPGSFLQQVSVSGKVVAAQNVNLGFSQSGRISAV